MQASNRGPFIARLVILASVYKRELSPALQVLYFEALQDLDETAVFSALDRAAKSCRFFPKPAELRELIEGDSGQVSELAWLELLREVRRVGYTGTPTLPAETLETIRGLWGSWRNLCLTLPGEGPEILGWAKRFSSAFTATSRQLEEPARIGRDEAKTLLSQITKRQLTT